jgi:integrase
VIEKRERKRRGGKAYSVYRVRWYEADGRERSRTFDSRADATAFEGKVRTLKRSDGLAQLDAGTETFAEFASEWWELYAKPNLERATLSNYASVFNKHLLPRIGHMRLRDLSVPTLMRLRADLEADGLGRQAVRKSLAVLQSILQRAVECERIGSNPARSVRKPPMQRDRAITPLTPETVERIRAALLGQGRVRDATLVSVLAYAGVRPQEAVALRWRNVRKNTLLIEQAVADGELKGQKTKRPPRTVSLLAQLREDLAAWRTEQQPESDEVFLFPSADGQPARARLAQLAPQELPAGSASSGVEDPRPYDLRHSFASLLIHEGRHSIVEIAAQLGHNPTTCLSTYAHVIAELQEAPRVPAEQQIRLARAAGRDTARTPPSQQLSLGDLGL